MHLEVSLLGRFEVLSDGVPVTAWRRAGVKRLFKLLVLAPAQGLTPSRLAAALWPDDFGERTRQRLHHQLYLLRAVLGRAGAVVVEEGLVRLGAERLSVDVSAFETAAARALQGGGEAEVAAALALYGGPLLPGDIDDAELDQRRQALEQRWADLLRRLAEAQTARGAAAEALGSLQQLLQRLPADEDAHRRAIALYAALGRREHAERQYAACRAALASEFGVAPSAATHQAYRAAMLDEDGGAAPAGIDAAAAPAERWFAPVPLVPLIARDALVQALAARFAQPGTRLVTLVGAGGLGKTQLALRIAHELQGRFRHGACFVSLAEVDGDGVADRLRRALRLPEPLTEDALERVAERLRDCQLLLVCDNCEHVADSLGVLTALLERAPLVTILATSRRRLNLRAEQIVDVPPLEASDDAAVRLFVERAAAAAPQFALDDGNADDVRAIVRQLQGLPLAIELVAARVALLPPAVLRRALEQDDAVVAGGGPDRPPRHRSMQASLAWSYELLTAHERAVLQRAALFVAPFELAGLSAVCADLAADIARSVQSLADLGLLARAFAGAGAPAPRWQMLPGTRAFLRGDGGDGEVDGGAGGGAGAPLPAPARPEVLRRFAAWHALLAQRLVAGLAATDAAPALAAFDADHENFFAALAAAAAVDDVASLSGAVQGLAPYWSRTGAWMRAAPWIARAEGLVDRLPEAERPSLLLAVASYRHDAHDYRRARAIAAQVAELARARSDLAVEAQALLRWSSACCALGEAHLIVAPLERLRGALGDLGDPAHAALRRSALNNAGNGWLCAGELVRAGAAWAACDAELPSVPSQARVVYVHNLALVAHYEGRHAEALALMAEAERFEATGVPRAARLAHIRMRHCWIACCLGLPDAAEAALARASDSADQARLPGWRLACSAQEGKLALVAGQAQRALALLARAAERRLEMVDPWDALDLLLWLCRAQAVADRGGAALGSTLALLVREFGRSWRLEHARILEAAAGWLLRSGAGDDAVAAAGRAWQQAQTLRRLQGVRRFPVDAAHARSIQAALRRRLGTAGLAACAAAIDEQAPLGWLERWLPTS